MTNKKMVRDRLLWIWFGNDKGRMQIPFGNDKQKDGAGKAAVDFGLGMTKGKCRFPSGMTNKKTVRERLLWVWFGNDKGQMQIPFGNDKQKDGAERLL